ncbi:nose resistant to fluoxetine protein 6-like isoform X1 [Branchiostoma floridae x Branchiostoma belcheri]
MKTTVAAVVALYSLFCCSQTVCAQGPAFYEFLGYLSGLERNKAVDWNSTLYLLYTGQVTPTCFTDAYRVYNDTILVKAYASNMLDSTGKMTPSGMFQGNWVAMGDYEECTVKANNAPDKPGNFHTMYCTIAWGGIPELLAAGNQFYAQGVCVPNSCTDKDVGLLTNTGLLGVKPMPSWYPIGLTCQREETYANYSSTAIAAIVIISIILIIVTVSSLYEFIITVYSPETRKALDVSARVFLSFSVFTNARKVFSFKSPSGQLPALHGIRVLSTLWIIFGHTNFFTLGNIEISNKLERDGASKEWWYFIQNNMDMAVDTFLLLSGLLVTYLFMKQLAQTGGVFTWRDYGLHLLHRYLRLTPVYAFLILIYTCLLVYMGDGPYWATPSNWVMPGIHGCQHNWWTNLLYINNYFVDSGIECFGWGWYLGVDMQLYVIIPGVLLLLYKKPKIGVILTCSLMVLSWVLHGVLYHFLVHSIGDYIATTYKYTVTRMAPYLLGVLLGYLLFRTNRTLPNIPHRKKLLLLGWFVGTVCSLAGVVTPTALFQNTDPPYYIQNDPAWRAMERSLFATGVAWVIYVSSVGYGGIISEFLSWSGWLPLSRLTYTAYLVHPMIMQVYYMSYKGALMYSGVNWLFLFISFSFLAFVCGFCASMMAEVPFLELEKFILPTRRGRQGRDREVTPDPDPERVDVERQQYQPLQQGAVADPQMPYYGSVST